MLSGERRRSLRPEICGVRQNKHRAGHPRDVEMVACGSCVSGRTYSALFIKSRAGNGKASKSSRHLEKSVFSQRPSFLYKMPSGYAPL